MMLEATRLICFIAWGVVFVYSTPAVWSLAMGKPRFGDAARLVIWGFALLMMMFCARWFFVSESEEVFVALYVLAIVWAVFTLLAAKSYGRDGRS